MLIVIFGSHPLSHLMGSIFGMHSQKHVEVCCYTLSQSDDSEWRLQSGVEHFSDVSSLSYDVIAWMISKTNIKFLINLNGYIKGVQNEIVAMKLVLFKFHILVFLEILVPIILTI